MHAHIVSYASSGGWIHLQTCMHRNIHFSLTHAHILGSELIWELQGCWSLSVFTSDCFFNVFLLTGQILARHSGGLWLTLSPQQGQNARQGPVFITSDRKHSLETELCTATLQRESVALLDANSKWIVVYDRPFYTSFGPAVDAAVLGLLDDSQILSRGSSWCEPVCPGLVFFLFFFFCLVFSYLFLSLHFFWLTLTKQGNWVVHIFFPLSPLNFSFW